MAKKMKEEKSCDCESCGEDHSITPEQIIQENNLLLHVLIDYLIEKDLISKVEFQDRLDLIESELFSDESDFRQAPKKQKKAVKKTPAKKKKK